MADIEKLEELQEIEHRFGTGAIIADAIDSLTFNLNSLEDDLKSLNPLSGYWMVNEAATRARIDGVVGSYCVVRFLDSQGKEEGPGLIPLDILFAEFNLFDSRELMMAIAPADEA